MAEIELTSDSKVVFSTDEIGGKIVASIRIFLESENYSGPTTRGLALTLDTLEEIVKNIDEINLPDLKKIEEDKTFAKILVNNFKSIVIHLTHYKGKAKLDIREFYTSKSYTGFGKKGIGIPISKIADFKNNLKELYKTAEAENTKLPQQATLSEDWKNNEKGNDDNVLGDEIKIDDKVTEEEHERIKAVAKKIESASSAEENKFSKLFRYFYEIFKHRATLAGTTDITSIDYFDLSEIISEELLFSGKAESITFDLPDEKTLTKLKKLLDKHPDQELDVELAKARTQLDAFNKIKQIFLTFQEKSYELELYLGFPLVSFKSNESEESLLGPLFLAKAEIIYDTNDNKFILTLKSDNFQLNLGLAGKLTSSLGKEYVQEKLLAVKPNLPLDEKEYCRFIKLMRDLLDLEMGKLPDNMELSKKPISGIMRDKGKYNISNKNVLFLARHGDFYILDDLNKLAELKDDIGETIISKFFSHDTHLTDDEADNNKKLEPKEYLFPFRSNSDQRKIATNSFFPLGLVEGPPGTGKSHTISNLICHLVANGNKVLVTSQKNKALEVVDQNYLEKTGINYLQMTLLKNDTKAKKILIEKISDLDYYLRDKSRWSSEKEIDKLKKHYLDTDNEINSFKVLFQRTLASEEENVDLYRKYSKIRNYDLIIDNIKNLDTKDIGKVKGQLLRLISFYKEILPEYESQIKHIVETTKCDYDEIKEILDLHESLVNLIKTRESIDTKGISDIKKMFSEEEFSSTKLDSLISASNELLDHAIKYEESLQSLKNFKESQIKDIAANITGSDFAIQTKVLEDLKKSVSSLRENYSFKDYLTSDITLTELEGMSKLIAKAIGSKKFYYSFMIFKKVWFSKYSKLIKNTDIMRSLHSEDLRSLDNSVKYWFAYRQTDQLSRSFIDRSIISEVLKNTEWVLSDKLEEMECLLVAVKSRWYLDQILKLKLNISKDLQENLLKNRSYKKLALTISSYFRIRKNEIQTEFTKDKIKSLVKDFWLEVSGIYSSNSDKKNLADIFKKVLVYLSAQNIEKDLPQFKLTVNSLKQSVRDKDKTFKLFEENIDKVFECEFIDNRIKNVEKEFPLSTQDIAKKIEVLNNKKEDITKKLIQSYIDFNLTKNYLMNSKVQRELSYFRKQLRRSKKSYDTFDEMKKEFDFTSLLNIFPCWIMGIDDVSRIFPLASGLFDYVIVDEASQCNLASSIPTLYRGKKAIVVGDEKQLSDFSRMWIPPKFNDLLIKNLSLHEIPKFDALDARFNSLFDSCSVFADRKTLLTEHFRSLPEIINFSNQKFYSNKLRIMTNSLNNRLGKVLNIVKVKNAKENDSKINETEAYAITEKLKEMVTDPKYTNTTIGVLSPFREQANFIRNLIFEDELLRTKIDDHQIISDTVDGFQGDERDVILYSFRYAPNSSPGIFNFMRSEDGWRRVNVAFTRPKKQVFCFISRDVKDFPAGYAKEFLQYIEDGQIDEFSIDKVFDSDFEKDVYSVLKKYKDIQVLPQFRTCGFRIDFVIMKNGKALALECDGMFHYDEHSELVEEDIERQDILERANWKVVRLTSREFYRNPDKSVDAIVNSNFN